MLRTYSVAILLINFVYFIEIKVCQKLSKPDNGNMFMISPDTAIFTCNSGFTTIGNSYLQCKDGKWSSPPPKCQPS